MTQSDMDEMFAPYGNIVTSRILCDLQTGTIRIRTIRMSRIRIAFTFGLFVFRGVETGGISVFIPPKSAQV